MEKIYIGEKRIGSMPRLIITFTDREQREIVCQSWKFDQSQLVIDYGLVGTEWINRNTIRSQREFKDDIPP
jgi:hypothetical protein